jgi:hypothetical protein
MLIFNVSFLFEMTKVQNKYLSKYKQMVTNLTDNTKLCDHVYLKLTKGPQNQEYNNLTTNCNIEANIPYDVDKLQLVPDFNKWMMTGTNATKTPILKIIFDMIKSKKFRAKIPTIPTATKRDFYSFGGSGGLPTQESWDALFPHTTTEGGETKTTNGVYMHNLFCGVTSTTEADFKPGVNRILHRLDTLIRHMLDTGTESIDYKSQELIADMFTMQYNTSSGFRRVLGNWTIYSILTPAILLHIAEKYRTTDPNNIPRSIAFEPVTYINYCKAGELLFSITVGDHNKFPKPKSLSEAHIKANLQEHWKKLVKFTETGDSLKTLDDLVCPFLINFKTYTGVENYDKFEDFLKKETSGGYTSQEVITTASMSVIMSTLQKNTGGKKHQNLGIPTMTTNNGKISSLFHPHRSYPFYNGELDISGRYGFLTESEVDYNLGEIFYSEFEGWGEHEIIPAIEHENRFLTTETNGKKWANVQNGYQSQITITYTVSQFVLFKIDSNDSVFKSSKGSIITTGPDCIQLSKIWTPTYREKRNCSYDESQACCESGIFVPNCKTVLFDTSLMTAGYENVVCSKIANAMPTDKRFQDYYKKKIDEQNAIWKPRGITVEPLESQVSSILFKPMSSWFKGEKSFKGETLWKADEPISDKDFSGSFKEIASFKTLTEPFQKVHFQTKAGTTLHLCAADDFERELDADYNLQKGKLCWFKYIKHAKISAKAHLRKVYNGVNGHPKTQKLYSIENLGNPKFAFHFMEKTDLSFSVNVPTLKNLIMASISKDKFGSKSNFFTVKNAGKVTFMICYEFHATFQIVIKTFYTHYFISSQDALGTKHEVCPQLLCPVKINVAFWMITANTLRRWCFLMLSKEVIEGIFKEVQAYLDAPENSWIMYVDRFMKTFGIYAKAICNENYLAHTFMNLPFGPPLLKIDYNFLLHFASLSAIHDLEFVEHTNNIFDNDIKTKHGIITSRKSSYVASDGNPRTVDRIYNQIIDASYYPYVIEELEHITHIHIPTAMSDLFKYSDQFFNSDEMISTFVSTFPFDDPDVGLGRLDLGRIFASKFVFDSSSIEGEVDDEEVRDGNGMKSYEYLKDYQKKDSIHFPRCMIQLQGNNISVNYYCMVDDNSKYTLYLSPADTVDSIGMDIVTIPGENNVKSFKYLNIPFKDRAELPPTMMPAKVELTKVEDENPPPLEDLEVATSDENEVTGDSEEPIVDDEEEQEEPVAGGDGSGESGGTTPPETFRFRSGTQNKQRFRSFIPRHIF